MSAIVCGKRSYFEEHSPTSPSAAPPPVSKRLRYGSPPARFSSFADYSAVEKLKGLFPNMDQKLIERALEENGNDIDSAIKSLRELCLGSDGTSGLSGEPSTNVEKGALAASEDGVHFENLSSKGTNQLSGAEWVELFVGQIKTATSIDDARSRAMGLLEGLEKSIRERAGAGNEAAQNLQKENMALKQQIEILFRENAILKRAVAIQHERQKEHADKNQEIEHLKQLVSQYQEQIRTLEVNNYALTMHLRQAQGNNSIPGRFHPDVF